MPVELVLLIDDMVSSRKERELQKAPCWSSNASNASNAKDVGYVILLGISRTE